MDHCFVPKLWLAPRMVFFMALLSLLHRFGENMCYINHRIGRSVRHSIFSICALCSFYSLYYPFFSVIVSISATNAYSIA